MTGIAIYNPLHHAILNAALGHRRARTWLHSAQTHSDQNVDQSAALEGVEVVTFRADVIETEASFVLRADLPGVAKTDITINVEGRVVSVKAIAKQAAKLVEGERWLLAERLVSASDLQYERRLQMPVELDDTAATAKFEHGVLELTLPRKASVPTKRVEVL
jgi:HSP20 family protein